MPKRLTVVYRIDFIEETPNNGAVKYLVLDSFFTQNPAALISGKIKNGQITVGNSSVSLTYNVDAAHKTKYDAYLNGYDLYSFIRYV